MSDFSDFTPAEADSVAAESRVPVFGEYYPSPIWLAEPTEDIDGDLFYFEGQSPKLAAYDRAQGHTTTGWFAFEEPLATGLHILSRDLGFTAEQITTCSNQSSAGDWCGECCGCILAVRELERTLPIQ